jgi:UDP-perosamine 4-acetyltransferase
MKKPIDNKIICIGAGGSTKVILDIIREKNNNKIIGILDDDESLYGNDLNGIKIIGKITDIANLHPYEFDEAIICVGAVKDTYVRKYIYEYLKLNNIKVNSVISKYAIISPNVIISSGLIAMPGVIINSGCKISENVFLNTGCIIEHDCIIEKNVFLSPGIVFSGRVTIKSNSFIGAGTVISTGITIGENVIVGAGSVIVRDIPDNVIVYGNPAHENMKEKFV